MPILCAFLFIYHISLRVEMNWDRHPSCFPQDAAVPMLQRLGLLGAESLPDLLGEAGAVPGVNAGDLLTIWPWVSINQPILGEF